MDDDWDGKGIGHPQASLGCAILILPWVVVGGVFYWLFF